MDQLETEQLADTKPWLVFQAVTGILQELATRCMGRVFQA